jgi:hypothetical protein
MPRALIIAAAFAVLALGGLATGLIAVLRRTRFGIDA